MSSPPRIRRLTTESLFGKGEMGRETWGGLFDHPPRMGRIHHPSNSPDGLNLLQRNILGSKFSGERGEFPQESRAAVSWVLDPWGANYRAQLELSSSNRRHFFGSSTGGATTLRLESPKPSTSTSSRFVFAFSISRALLSPIAESARFQDRP